MRGTSQQIAQYLTKGFWDQTGEIPRSFGTGADTIAVNLTGLDAGGQGLARRALDEWSTVSGLTFAEGSGDTGIIFDDSENDFARTGWIYSPQGPIVSANVTVPASTIGSGSDGEAYALYLHEIGHALGLGHPGPYDQLPEGEDRADPGLRRFDNDTYLESVTSYFLPENDPDGPQTGTARPVTPMAADVAAMQMLYGPAGIRGGDTVYGGPGNDAGAAFAGFGPGMLATVADTGGTDTIDLSRFGAVMDLDLRAGSVSTFRDADGALAIAEGTLVEQALGSAGDDRIFGNSADNLLAGRDGDDLLNGRLGADELRGGRGEDTLRGGRDDDTLLGHAGDDRLFGNGHADTLRGHRGEDGLFGGWGHDRLEGGIGADLLLGQKGNDRLLGGLGHDVLFGGPGADILNGQKGNDVMTGGAGADTFVFAHFVPGQTDTVRDFESGIDVLRINGPEFDDLDIQRDGVDTEISHAGFRIVLEGVDGLDIDDFAFV